METRVSALPRFRTKRWTASGEVMRAVRRLIASDNMAQKETAKVEAELAIARAIIRAGR